MTTTGRDWSKVSEIVRQIRKQGLSLKEGAKQAGVEVGVLYEYNRHESKEKRHGGEVGGKGHGEEPAKGRERQAAGLPKEVQERICAYRRAQPKHGFKRIADELKQKYLVVVTRKQIRRVLKEAGLLETCDSSFDTEEPDKKGRRRFEASGPCELWQMDVAYVYIRKLAVLYLVVIVDDYSRYCVAAELCRDQRAETLLAVLHNASTEHGAPRKLLTDQGSGFYSWSGEQTRFQEYLDDHRIEHIVADPHSPQTQGKAERLIQTIRVELLSRVKFIDYADAREQILAYIRGYNFERPHQGINGQRPADRFHGVVGEVSRVESELAGRELDLSRGYVVYKVQDHRVSVVCAAERLQVYLDGKLLKEVPGDVCER
ncbi:MAG: DDE-type integrase/transposase/recombinase [Acidobacteriota bacterium]